MPNRLASATSPYLLQHSDNPVDWYEWGPEALARSAAEDKPILLSIGYAACHWCHVMAHESFEDEATARLMNEHFVNIKVDREERPDLDGIYMQAVQAMTGHGGWPMTVFLTPSGEPFYGGTYFPPVERHGMPSFKRLLLAISESYRTKPDAVASTARQLREMFAHSAAVDGRDGATNPEVLASSYRVLTRTYDAERGGFGGAPKFPPSMTLDFLLRHWARTGTGYARDIVLHSFRAMARGGIFDQVGGGIHRYSTDARWLVPHFEKMLYDNALFARLGVELWQATGEQDVRAATLETFAWVAREMTSPEGGFYSSLDADSEGEEGKFYVWDDGALSALLGVDAEIVREYWGTTPSGNFEGHNILHVPNEPSMVARRHGLTLAQLGDVLARARERLYSERATRVWPALDDKILASWNGLMLRALAQGVRVLGDVRVGHRTLRELAIRNGEFLRAKLVRDGRVVRSFRNGVASSTGFLEDHAAVALGFLELYALTFDASWLNDALEIADATLDRFFDADRGLFFDTASDHEALITRPRDVTDNAIPCGSSLVADLLLRLSVITGDSRGGELARRHCDSLAEALATHPSAFGHLLGVADMTLYGATEVALVGDRDSDAFRKLEEVLAGRYVPALVLVGGAPDPDSKMALLRGRSAPAGGATAYLCRDSRCEAPTSDAGELQEQLEAFGAR